MNETKRILIGVDDSEASERAVSYVADVVAGRREFQIRLFNVLPPLPPSLLHPDGAEDPKVKERLAAELRADKDRFFVEKQEETERVFSRLKRILEDAGVPPGTVQTQSMSDHSEVVSEFEEVVSDILEVANTEGFDTVVIGRGRLSRWQELFRHHVSTELTRRAQGLTVWVVGGRTEPADAETVHNG